MAKSLILSRITHMVHTCQSFADKPRSVLTRINMTMLRRIYGEAKFGRCTHTDEQVRWALGAPSLDSIIRQQRLLVWSRLSRSEVRSTIALVFASAPGESGVSGPS